jgi:hypothetical protein
MANQVKDGRKELKQKYLQTESTIKNFISRNLSNEPRASPEIIRTHSVYVSVASVSKSISISCYLSMNMSLNKNKK